MPQPPKTIGNASGHRTAAERTQREDAEAALQTGIKLRERPEVKSSPLAHSEFLRVNKLLKSVGKNDALIETVINRYCILLAECADLEKIRTEFRQSREELQEEYHSGIIDSEDDLKPSAYYKLLATMQKNIIDVDKQLQTKRRMLLDIEKENGLTISAALRSIPKKVDKNENPLLKALRDDPE